LKWVNSVPVLATDGVFRFVAVVRYWDEQFGATEWVIKWQDGRPYQDVTHWQPLLFPPLPKGIA
jgi:hypothetical protein